MQSSPQDRIEQLEGTVELLESAVAQVMRALTPAQRVEVMEAIPPGRPAGHHAVGYKRARAKLKRESET